ncbi:MAG: hypothetical protein V9E90_03390, partial [Saprospiraceae bacterium]
PVLTLTKSAVLDNTVVAPNDQSNPGDTIAYTVTVVNSGNGPATNVVVTDPLVTLSCLPASGSTLAASATMTCTGTYTLVAGDVGNGSVSNTATVAGGNVCNPTTVGSTCSDTEVTPLGLVPVLTLTKSAVLDNTVVAPNDQSNPGDTIAYTVTVVNSGNGPATNVVVTDPLVTLSCLPASGSTLAASATMTCTGTYTLVAGDVGNGSVSNTATVAGGNVCNPTTVGSTCSDTEVTPLGLVPVLTLTKSAVLDNTVVAPNDQSNPGDTIAYTVTVVNSGNGPATNVVVTDPLVTLSCLPASGSTLAASATMTCTGTYTLVAGDVGNGSVSNTATVAGGNVCNPTTVGSTCSDTEVTPLGLVPVLTLTKSAVLDNTVVAPNDQSNPGDTIAYTVTVVNSGNGPATNVVVTDPLVTLSCLPASGSTLAASATMTCTGTYTLVAGDVGNGSVSNTATVAGGNVCNPTTVGSTCSDTEVTPLGLVPVLTLTKSAVLDNTVVAPNDQSNPGDTIAYTVTVVNSGNGPATNVVVTDPLVTLSCLPASGSTLAASATMTCTGTYTLVAGDVGNGSVSNTATVAGGNVCNPTTVGSTCSDTEVTPLGLVPVLTLTKSAVLDNTVVAPNDQSNPGDTIAYTVTVVNSGNGPATNVVVTDPLVTLSCLPASGSTLAASATMTCTGTYTLVAGDVGNGSVSNTATVAGGNVCNPTTVGSTCSDTEVTPLGLVPVLTLTKSAVLDNTVVAPNDQSNPGDTIAYTVTVVNSGNGPATNVVVTDPLVTLSCLPASGSTLAASATMTCTGTYTLVAGDVGNGSVSNTATVAGGNVCNPTTVGSTCSDTEVTPLGLVPVLTLTKSAVLDNTVVAPNDQSNPGDTIAYTVTVVNSGNGPATNVVVTDPLVTLSCLPASGSTLAASATMTCTGTYTLVAGDVGNGSVSNTATVAGGNVCNPTTVGSTCSDTEVTPLGLV